MVLSCLILDERLVALKPYRGEIEKGQPLVEIALHGRPVDFEFPCQCLRIEPLSLVEPAQHFREAVGYGVPDGMAACHAGRVTECQAAPAFMSWNCSGLFDATGGRRQAMSFPGAAASIRVTRQIFSTFVRMSGARFPGIYSDVPSGVFVERRILLLPRFFSLAAL